MGGASTLGAVCGLIVRHKVSFQFRIQVNSEPPVPLYAWGSEEEVQGNAFMGQAPQHHHPSGQDLGDGI